MFVDRGQAAEVWHCRSATESPGPFELCPSCEAGMKLKLLFGLDLGSFGSMHPSIVMCVVTSRQLYCGESSGREGYITGGQERKRRASLGFSTMGTALLATHRIPVQPLECPFASHLPMVFHHIPSLA